MLLRMRDDIHDVVDIAPNHKIESPVSVHPRLPQILRFIELLRVEGRVAQAAFQKSNLLEERFSTAGGMSRRLLPARSE